jgi:hypothetical protein
MGFKVEGNYTVVDGMDNTAGAEISVETDNDKKIKAGGGIGVGGGVSADGFSVVPNSLAKLMVDMRGPSGNGMTAQVASRIAVPFKQTEGQQGMKRGLTSYLSLGANVHFADQWSAGAEALVATDVTNGNDTTNHAGARLNFGRSF